MINAILYDTLHEPKTIILPDIIVKAEDGVYIKTDKGYIPSAYIFPINMMDSLNKHWDD